MAADNIKYRFIQNIGDYFPSGYFSEDFIDKVQKASGLNSDDMGSLCVPFVSLRQEYEKYKNYIVNTNPRVKDVIRHTHDFHTLLLKILGYSTDTPYDRFYSVDEEANSVVPVRHILSRNGRTSILVMEMQPLIKTDDKEPAGLFGQQYNVEINGLITEQTIRHQQYYAGQWSEVFSLPEDMRISPAVINKAIDALFLLPEDRRPHFILMLAGNIIFLLDSEKWNRGAYLEFSLDELFSQASISAFRKYYALFHLLTCKETLASDSETILMDTLVEDSYKNAYEVTKDLKDGVILAVETLANEALYYKKSVVHEGFGRKNEETGEYDETDDNFEAEVKDDCLTIVYRLLFIFYAESRSELEILPTGDDVYKQGYSLEKLRDLEQTRLNSQQSRDGYFFDDSIQNLFRLLSSGYNKADSMMNNKSFRIRPIDSPLFNNNCLHHLGDVRIRNCKWQEIICALSLSKKNSRYGRGRISYANLGVNQLGSVYESLLAFRGFYAEEDYIEVHKAGHPEDGTFLVPYSRMDDFEENEILRDEEDRPKILPRGTFVYRLNGRDRQKSASYYTPEVLTRSTVKYTLKSIIDDVAAGKRKATDLLELKILEPAMGAAAFQNEVINQLSEAYLTYQQQQQRERGLKNWRISPDHYRDELQKVKAFIATHNVYGVDLNPTAIELGKLSLWLNVIHKDMETPFFANRLTVGNAVIGAWLKVYNRDEIYGIKGRKKLEQNKWWERAPHKIEFYTNRVKRSVNEVYHFLLPDNNMLGVRSISEQKKANKEANNRMITILKDWTAPINANDFATLQRISAKIDVLLKDYFTAQLSIDKYTNNRKEIWDGIDHAESDSMFKEEECMESYARKQQLFDTRYGHDNAYHKLKLVMDYWCALWFWEYADAFSLPTRTEYWGDIEALLNVDNEKIDSRTSHALERAGSNMLFEDDVEYNRITEEESQIVLKSQTEILTEAHANVSLFADEEPLRLQIVERLANRYHFFHPMLEFIEVFWLRDGFDIICGNPPWLKWEFEIQNVIGEKFPEVLIREDSATDVLFSIKEYLSDETMAALCKTEQVGFACGAAFMNGYCNYPLLKGQQTDLYKSILSNSLVCLSNNGYMGMVLPESMYDDAKGQDLRRYLYLHLHYHFQYQNALNLFPIAHRRKYGVNIFKGNEEQISFYNINDLFHPSTIDACFAHDGHGNCGGVKNEDGNWDTSGHKDRIILYDAHSIQLLSTVFEEGEANDCAKLVSIHSSQVLDIIDKLANYTSKVASFFPLISECLHETNAPKAKIIKDIKDNTKTPDLEMYEMIYNAPHIYVSNPIYQTPRVKSSQKGDFDSVNLQSIEDNYIQRTKYIPLCDGYKDLALFRGFNIGQDENGEDEYDNWLDYYKVGFRKMINLSGERSLICAVLPSKTAHIHGVISVAFRNGDHSVDMAALCSSLVMDFYWKTVASQNLTSGRIQNFPHGFERMYQSALRARTLRLNCLSNNYSVLWTECWNADYTHDEWSIADSRLAPWSELTSNWQHNTPLRNYFERRQALVEIDVIVAMALGLNLKELEMMYNIQFPVLQQNENDTWYDTRGNIVFTCSKGLTGVGVDRPVWNTIKDMTDGETYTHTIEKSELYRRQQVTYYAPFTKCDRIEDYSRAWAHFENQFK